MNLLNTIYQLVSLTLVFVGLIYLLVKYARLRRSNRINDFMYNIDEKLFELKMQQNELMEIAKKVNKKFLKKVKKN